ncbi:MULTISPECIES: hypothetical protein [Sphingomonas]|uniref:hypothetical protein n=1 Tax=Sphingomonas TaxID=13687 RepID=UPI001922BE5E|nr:hypothetical protein [Sphingomonas sp. CCH10-B3]
MMIPVRCIGHQPTSGNRKNAVPVLSVAVSTRAKAPGARENRVPQDCQMAVTKHKNIKLIR